MWIGWKVLRYLLNKFNYKLFATHTDTDNARIHLLYAYIYSRRGAFSFSFKNNLYVNRITLPTDVDIVTYTFAIILWNNLYTALSYNILPNVGMSDMCWQRHTISSILFSNILYQKNCSQQISHDYERKLSTARIAVSLGLYHVDFRTIYLYIYLSHTGGWYIVWHKPVVYTRSV
jgi:hypothetical protein